MKTDPIPPVKPAEMGRGRPLYKADEETGSSLEKAMMRNTPPATQKDEKDDEE